MALLADFRAGRLAAQAPVAEDAAGLSGPHGARADGETEDTSALPRVAGEGANGAGRAVAHPSPRLWPASRPKPRRGDTRTPAHRVSPEDGGRPANRGRRHRRGRIRTLRLAAPSAVQNLCHPPFREPPGLRRCPRAAGGFIQAAGNARAPPDAKMAIRLRGFRATISLRYRNDNYRGAFVFPDFPRSPSDAGDDAASMAKSARAFARAVRQGTISGDHAFVRAQRFHHLTEDFPCAPL